MPTATRTTTSENQGNLPHHGWLTAVEGQQDSVLLADVNLPSRESWDDWHHWLAKLGIHQKQIRGPGEEVMARPVFVKRGKRAYRVWRVELRGPASALTQLERFRPKVLLECRPVAKGTVSLRGVGQTSPAAVRAIRARQRRARARLGAQAAKQPLDKEVR